MDIYNKTNITKTSSGIKPGASVVMIRYQVDEFTHTWSVENFIVQSHIYTGFTGKVSILTHFPLKPVCEDYSILDQAVEDFVVLILSSKTPMTPQNEMHPLMSQMPCLLQSPQVFSTW